MTEPTRESPVQPDYDANDGRGLRCSGCGHYASEHSDRCHGAYATLMADADDHESVEVLCHCTGFYFDPEALWHEVRNA